jgi:hypothetical protein
MSSQPENDLLVEQSEYEAPSPAAGSTLPYVLCLTVLLGMAYGGWKWWQVRQFELTGGDAIPVGQIGPPLKEFELTERSGSRYARSICGATCGSLRISSQPALASVCG